MKYAIAIQSDEVAKGMQQVNVNTQNNYHANPLVNSDTFCYNAGSSGVVGIFHTQKNWMQNHIHKIKT